MRSAWSALSCRHVVDYRAGSSSVWRADRAMLLAAGRRLTFRSRMKKKHKKVEKRNAELEEEQGEDGPLAVIGPTPPLSSVVRVFVRR